jgi:hypothetical protein
VKTIDDYNLLSYFSKMISSGLAVRMITVTRITISGACSSEFLIFNTVFYIAKNRSFALTNIYWARLLQVNLSIYFENGSTYSLSNLVIEKASMSLII